MARAPSPVTSNVPTTRAVILAAGRGQRLGGLTDDRPKCLCTLADRPIVAWTIDALRANGISEILIVGGWQAAALGALGLPVRVNPGWAGGNMVRSLLQAADWLESAPTLIVYGDCAYSVAAIANALDAPDSDILLPVDLDWLRLWRIRFADPLSDAESLVLADGFVRDIGRRPVPMAQIEGQFMGLLRLSRRGWQLITAFLAALTRDRGEAAVDRLDMTGLLQQLIAAGHRVAAQPTAGGWVEVDSPEDLAAIEQALAQPGFSHDFRG